jgi:hypothetical protein
MLFDMGTVDIRTFCQKDKILKRFVNKFVLVKRTEEEFRHLKLVGVKHLKFGALWGAGAESASVPAFWWLRRVRGHRKFPWRHFKVAF